MPTITITASSPCAGGNHIVLSVSGAVAFSVPVSVDDLREIPTEEAKRDAALALVRLYSQGKTKAQVRSGLLAGIVVTL